MLAVVFGHWSIKKGVLLWLQSHSYVIRLDCTIASPINSNLSLIKLIVIYQIFSNTDIMAMSVLHPECAHVNSNFPDEFLADPGEARGCCSTYSLVIN